MNEIITFLLLGLGSGGLIAGMGLGVVLSYRGAGVINLAVGAVAMIAGYFFWAIKSGRWVSMPTVPAVILTLIFSVLVGVIFDLLVVRPQRTATPLAKLIAALGVLLALQALVVVTFGQSTQPQPPILPSNNLTLLGVPVASYNFVITGILLVITVTLIAVYRWSRFGIATRAAAENEAHAMFIGLSPNTLSLVNTVLMSTLMGVVGLLAASVTQLDSSTLPLLVVPGLAAAMFGRFTSFGTTFVSGVLIGMGESLLLYFSSESWFPNDGGVGNPLPGVQQLLIFIILVIAMFWRAGKIPSRGDVLEQRLPMAPPAKNPLRSTLIYGAACAIALPLFPGTFRGALVVSLITAILLLSLVIITGYLGQVSLVQLAVGGAAGFAMSHFSTNFGIGFPWAPIMSVLIATFLGLICGIPALRVRGVSLAVVTLAAAVAIENFGFANTTWGGGASGSPVAPPSLFGWNFGPNASVHGLFGAEPSPLFGWFTLLVLIAMALIVNNLRRSGLGLDMLAVRSNERAAAAAGIGVRYTKLLGFALSSAVAGVGGVMLAYQYGSITPDSYDTLTALALIAFAYISGITTVAGAIWGGTAFIGGIVAWGLQDWFGLQGEWFSFAGGILLVFTLIREPAGIATRLFYGPRASGKDAGSRPRHDPSSSSSAGPVNRLDEVKVAS
jgi:ABC-type branched-subunit amino acid transport system permease subunit